MQVSLNSTTNYKGFEQAAEQKNNKDTERKVVTGGGAVAAAAGAARTKAARSGFDMFNSARRASQGVRGVTETTRTTADVATKTKGLWAKVAENARWAKNAIMNWGDKFKKIGFINRIVKSKLFMKTAGALGYGFGLVTLISGLSDITKVTTEAIEGKLKIDNE